MKKVFNAVIGVILCLSLVVGLVACGGADKQPLIDSYNRAADAFNELADLVNENSENIDDDNIAMFNEMADLLDQYKELAESDDELSQEQIDNMINWLDNDLTTYCKTTTENLKNAIEAINSAQ